MILCDHDIIQCCKGNVAWVKAPMVEPFIPEHVNSHSLDVTLSRHFIAPDGRDVRRGVFELMPGDVVLASTAEHIVLPEDLVAFLSLKSSIARQWINHSMAGWIYPGFEGNITLELHNLGRSTFFLREGLRIAQLTFMPASPAHHIHKSSLPGTLGTVAVLSAKKGGDLA